MTGFEPIVDSVIDTDLYKLTMQQVVWRKFPWLQVVWKLKCRTASVDLSPYAGEIRDQVRHYCNLRLSSDEIAYLDKIAFLHPEYTRTLRDLRLDPDLVEIKSHPFDLIAKGSEYSVSMLEVPILEIVQEVFSRAQPGYDDAISTGRERLAENIAWLKENVGTTEFNLIEFGSRRRFSREWQREVDQTLLREFRDHPYIHFLGTSNVKNAQLYGLSARGTMAHSYLQEFQALSPLHHFQRQALEVWGEVYKGNLGIALSDVIGMDAFLADFHLGFAKQFDGCRHDSGDPFEWGEKLISHYEILGIDPRTKNAVFSDSLDFKLALQLAQRFNGRIRTQFGIGTFLTNDMGVKGLNLVMKIIEADGQPVAKLSDSEGKQMCEDAVYLAHLRAVVDRIKSRSAI